MFLELIMIKNWKDCNYNFYNLNQLEKLLIKNNYSFYSKNDNFFILKNGVETSFKQK